MSGGIGITDRFRRLVGLEREEPALTFECHRCGASFEMNRQQCPECDGFDIRRRAWSGSGTA
ncbi:hypothetical protein [Candidatus Halobonum tyrrellensis]|uniref:Small CPxCG-related zinc finger protein n=1 Tax=Candidatus Halobonum tyrrellensis G22 TaxID=1324957 RepID=V4HCG9_9EURY|nr:hypothetical protein [Candidatus Halobonum tyrrellensis]ESP88380.1 hypothetical protein K933_09662 [Candidatus Halobonum tyrrellensis G22]